MRKGLKLIYCIIILICSLTAWTQNYVEPIANYTFNNNSVVDERGNSELFLRNKTSLFSDTERGYVLRFSEADKGYAVFNKQLLNSDTCTISFFFLWENSGAGSWHQLFEIHNQETNSNLFFTPQNGWGNNQCSFISDSKEYDLYETVNSDVLSKNVWMHIAITVEGKRVKIYIDGDEASSSYIMITPSLIKADSLYLGCNPMRSNNYYISARLDEIKVFDQALSVNQVKAVYQETEIPAPENSETNWEPTGSVINLDIDLFDKKQTIQNFGSSDGWNTERIGKYWPVEKKEKLAELLFSTDKDSLGNPRGIGLSAWRFNIGAGTTEQGESSRISVESRRTEGFLNADGTTYNWDKQLGQQWFLKEAVNTYDIHHVIGWQNSPPVAYTQNNLGFRDYGASMSTILKQEHYPDFARFLADVSEHFENQGIHFDYISPLNEPQWGWAPSSSGGTVTQEGTPWTNKEIFDVVKEIDEEFTTRSIATKIFIAEAGSITRLYSGSAHADNQLNKFWNSDSELSLIDKPSFANIVSFHSYFTDYGASLVDVRSQLYNKSQALSSTPQLWQTEYSLLGNGYRNGYPSNVKLSEMECALSLSKVMMSDLNIANTTAWQWWTTFEKGKHSGESRYCFVEAITKNDNSDGTYHLNKLFYTFGHFSHFIRPGMTRIDYSRSDNQIPSEELSNVVFSAYTNAEENKLIIVAANYTEEAKETKISINNSTDIIAKNPSLYLTDEYSCLEKVDIDLSSGKLIVPARSVITYTADLEPASNTTINRSTDNFRAYFNETTEQIIGSLEPNHAYSAVNLYNLEGKLLDTVSVDDNQLEVIISTSQLSNGIYLVSGISTKDCETKKILVF